MTDVEITAPTARKKLRVAAVLLILGLVLEGIAMAELTPFSFLLFAFIGAPCLLAAMVLYLGFVVNDLRRKHVL